MGISGQVRFTGSAARNAEIELRDDAGKSVASTTADASGQWRIEAIAMPVGKHVIHAVARSEGGKENVSPNIKVDVYADDVLSDEPEFEVEADDYEPSEVYASTETVSVCIAANGELQIECDGAGR